VAYRLSANPAKCQDPTKWYSTTKKVCFNGLAQNVTFTFHGTKTFLGRWRYGQPATRRSPAASGAS